MHYIEGPNNILADNLSRLHRLVTPAQIAEGKNLIDPADVSEEEDAFMIDPVNSGLNNKEILDAFECYLNLPDDNNLEKNMLTYNHICEQQKADRKLLELN